MKLINILLLFLLFTQFCVSQTIDEKYEFTLKAVEKNNKEGIFLYMNDILDYEKENGIDTNYLNTLEFYIKKYYSFFDYQNSLKLHLEIVQINEKIFGSESINFLSSLTSLAINYSELNNFYKSVELNIKCLKLEEKLLGKEHPDYLMTLNNLAYNYGKLGNFDKSLELNLECLKIKEKILGKEHPQYLITLHNLANDYSNLGDYTLAIKLSLNCLISREMILGKEHPDYLLSLKYSAYCFKNLGDFSKASELYLECLNIEEKIIGKKNPDYLVTLNNLADNYSELGNYQKSLELQLECLKIGGELLGKEHPDYLTILDNLAMIYSEIGNYQKSLELNLECLNKTEKIFGKDHPDYLIRLSNRANNLIDFGNYKQGLELNLECSEKAEKILGKFHPQYYMYLICLAHNFYELGYHRKAIEITNYCLNSVEKKNGIEHPEYARILNILAILFGSIGDESKSLELNIECLKITEKIFGKEHPKYLNILNCLSNSYLQIGNYSKALELNLECLKSTEIVLGNEHPIYLKCLSTLQNIYEELGNYQKSLETTLDLLKKTEQIFGKEHRKYLDILSALSINYYYLKNHQKSLELQLECLKKREKILGKKHPDYLITLGNLASIYRELGNHQKSLELNLECLNKEEKIFGKDHPSYLTTLGNLALIYSKLGDHQKSLDLNLECLKKRGKIFGKQHPSYLLSLSNTSSSYFDLKQYHNTDSLTLIENRIIIKEFQNNLIGLNQDLQVFTKSKFTEKIEYFLNYSILRKNENPTLLSNAFNSWLNLNGMISNQSAQLESQIRMSKDSSLIQLFEKWQVNKIQILKYYELTKSELEKRGINIAELEEEINEQERVLSRGSEVFSEMKKTYVLSDIQQQLKEDEAYVDIVRLPYYNFNTNVWSDTIRYLAYIITKDTKEIPTTVLLENGNQLEEEIASYYAENTFGKTKREKDSISYAYFWKPISSALEGKRKIYLSSGGVYNNINVQTLFNPSTNKYVSEELEVQLVNNGRTFIQQKTKKPQVYTNNTATFIGYPNFNGTLSKGSINEDAIYATSREFSPMLLDTLSRGANVSPLPGTKKEVETIGELLKTKKWDVNVFTENNASEEEIKKVESPRVLHIATHGYFLKQTDNLQKESGLRMMGMDTKRFVENPLLRSGLLLSGANKTLKGDTSKASENGILTAYEAAYLHLQGTELVVLSACETGKGELKNGEGVYGLRKSFADAGAKNIIMSLWKVDDKVTQEFMTSFYTNWSTGITIREAFNKTQQSIKALYPQPYYWGAFILVGE